jgi:FkbM family methyltransferase
VRRLLHAFRFVRDRVPAVRWAYRPLREPYYRILVWLFPRGIKAELVSRDVVRLHPRFLVLKPEAFEPELTRLMAERVRPGATVLDIGAHVGLHTLMFSRRAGTSGRVLAIEPSPVTAALLMQHLAWNGCNNVEVFEAAVGHEEREVVFAYRADPTDMGACANSLAYDIGGKKTNVKMTTIDRICTGRNPDLIKMDIEGAELLALRGAQQTLTRAAPLLVVSIHPEAMRALGTTPAELVTFLSGFGYQGRHLDGRPVAELSFGEFVFSKQTALSTA